MNTSSLKISGRKMFVKLDINLHGVTKEKTTIKKGKRHICDQQRKKIQLKIHRKEEFIQDSFVIREYRVAKNPLQVQIYYSLDSNGPQVGIYETHDHINKPHSRMLCVIQPVHYGLVQLQSPYLPQQTDNTATLMTRTEVYSRHFISA
jgi:hypothetical protein